MIYFSSDLHLGHQKEFIYKPRGFNSIEEMNRTIIKNFNQVLNYDDDLYLLGDTVMGAEPPYYLFKQLNCRVHLIWGNHCTLNKQKELMASWNVVEICGYATLLKYKGYNFYLSHYPTYTSNYDDNKPLKHRVLSLSGHTHSKEKFEECGSYNVAVDAHNCFPVSIEQIIKDFTDKVS